MRQITKPIEADEAKYAELAAIKAYLLDKQFE
jgi:hypothetical protein